MSFGIGVLTAEATVFVVLAIVIPTHGKIVFCFELNALLLIEITYLL